MNLRTCLSTVVLLSVGSALALAAEEAPTKPTRLGHAFLCTDYGGNKVLLVDKDGRIEWEVPARQPQDAWLLANGNILLTHVKGVQEVTRDKKVVWEYKTTGSNEIHACQPLPNGVVMVAESGPCRIIEVDRAGKIVAEVKLTTDCKRAHGQMRNARKLANGHYLIGQYSDGVVREYDPSGRIVWQYKPKKAFGGIRLPDGNTLIATGDGHQVIEVDPKGEVVWEINENDLPGNPLRFVAGLQRLPNGNTVICNWGGHGRVGQQPQIVEVTRDKKVVSALHDDEQFKTISGVFILGVPGDVTRCELLR